MNRRGFVRSTGALMLLPALGGISLAQTGKIPFEDEETLESIREKIARNGYSFTVGRNADYDQFAYPGTPHAQPEVPPSPMMTFTGSDFSTGIPQALPSSFDLRNYNGHSYIGPIRNQGGTGMCYAFAACAAAEAAYNLKNGLFDDNCVVLSPMYLTRTLNLGSSSDLTVFYMLTKTGDPFNPPKNGQALLQGACHEMDFPFAPFWDQAGPVPPPDFQIEKSKLAPRVTLKRCGSVFATDYSDTTARIKAAIFKYGAVKVSVRQSSSAFKAYKSGVYEDTYTVPSYTVQTGHDVSLVGWDDNPPEGGSGCWILRNEWGTSWGEGGYMRIRYFSALVNTSAVFMEASSPGDGELSIVGHVTVDGKAAADAIVTLSGAYDFATSTSSGKYAFQALKPGNYRLTPTQPGITFNPPFRDLVVDNQNLSGINFGT